MPVVLAWRRGNDEERLFWRRTLENLNQTEQDMARAIDLMKKHNTLKDTVDRARHYGAIARDSLGIFRACPMKDALIETVDFAVNRRANLNLWGALNVPHVEKYKYHCL